MQGDSPVDLTGLTVKVYGETHAGGTDWITATATGVTAHPTNAFTTNTLDDFDVILDDDTLAKNGYQVKFSSTGTLPAGLVTGVWYFVVGAFPGGFKVSRQPNGATLNITDAGTGTHTYIIRGSVQYEWQAADVDTAGTFWLWFRVGTDTVYDTYPTVPVGTNRGFSIEVVEAQ
jgi:hypothetical protein